jgi:hypothetical protein
MKSRIKFWSFVTVMLFALAALGLGFVQPAAAASPTDIRLYLAGDAIPPYECSAYEVGGPSSGNVIVTLILEAGDVLDSGGEAVANTAFYVEVSKDLGQYPKTVSGLLQAVSDDVSIDLKFYGKSGTGLAPFTPATNYVAAVEHNAKQWKEGGMSGGYGFNGWEFRVNDKFPTQKFTGTQGVGWEGTDILQTPVGDGDIVHWFYEFPSTLYSGGKDAAANYARAVYKYFANNTLTLQLRGHKVYIQPTPPYTMEIGNYVNLSNIDPSVTASIYMADGVTPVPGAAQNQAFNAYGTVTFTSASLAAGGTYIVKTTPTYYTDEDWDFIDGAFFSQTRAYSKVTIPVLPAK